MLRIPRVVTLNHSSKTSGILTFKNNSMSGKMKNKKIILVGLFITLLIIILIILIIFLFKQQTAVQTAKIEKVCFKQACFNVKIAETQEEREKGLMGIEYLDKNNGMLFIFPESGKYNFWMKNTLIPLDIIWIDSNNAVIEIKENFQPCKENIGENCDIYYSKKNALYVLEINGNTVSKNDIKIGDKIIFY